jgi:2-iminobutanoate/2-iminopropanoate deaminase
MMRRSLLLCAAFALGACAHAAPPQYIAMPGSIARPFSAAVVANGMIYLSGQIGVDSMGKLAPGGIGPETKLALENVRALLAQQGATMSDVVKCTVFLADIQEWAAMNAVYMTFFPKNPPARSAFGTSGIALNGRVEIECLAVMPEKKGS